MIVRYVVGQALRCSLSLLDMQVLYVAMLRCDVVQELSTCCALRPTKGRGVRLEEHIPEKDYQFVARGCILSERIVGRPRGDMLLQNQNVDSH